MDDPFAALEARPWRAGQPFSPDGTRALLARLGEPQRALRVVHVGGTNGKGSVVAMLDSALRESGQSVGRLTSPAVTRYADQVRVDGRTIPDDFARSFLDEHLAWAGKQDTPLTGFEILSAMAIAWFARERVDVALVEVGLGGARDATNVFDAPLATVVTNVANDHLDVIGPTIQDAAREKAGIARPRSPLVTGAEGEALDALLAEAARLGVARARVLGRDFHAEARATSLEGTTFTVRGLARAWPEEMRVALPGRHQAANAALALATLDLCDAAGLGAPVNACARGLAKVEWPGRLQHVPGAPSMLLDGAHNPAGVDALVAFLRELDLRPVVLFGCLDDKPWMDMVTPLAERAKAVVVTRPPSPRALDPAVTAREFSRAGVVATSVPDPKWAYATAAGQAGEDGLVLVTGSLYLVGEVLRWLA